MLDLQRFTLPDCGLISKADKQKLDNLDNILTTTEAADSFVTKSALADYIANVVPTSDGFIVYNGHGNVVCNAILRRGKSSPNLTLDKDTIIIPDTITANWDGDGELSVSLQNDIANYAISGDQIIFSLKDTYEAGSYSTDGLIIIGENDSYESDAATFTASAEYVVKQDPRLRLSSRTVTFCDKYLADTVTITATWDGTGELSFPTVGTSYFSVERQPTTVTTEYGKAVSRANLIFTKTALPGTFQHFTRTLTVNESNYYLGSSLPVSISAFTGFDKSYSRNGTNTDRFAYISGRGSLNNSGTFCYVDLYTVSSSAARVTMSATDCTCTGNDCCITVEATGGTASLSKADYCTVFSGGSGIGIINNAGSYCSLDGFAGNCTVRNYSGHNSTINGKYVYNSGNDVYIEETAYCTIASGKTGCTICNSYSTIDANNNAVTYIWNCWMEGYIYNYGDNSTIFANPSSSLVHLETMNETVSGNDLLITVKSGYVDNFKLRLVDRASLAGNIIYGSV